MKTMRVRVKFVASRREAMPEKRSGSIGRAGTSLTEVLMSLMIMSIGVVSVATLFPISALRTLEANKQTNSTIARFAAEAFIDVDPQFIHNPDGTYLYAPGGGMPSAPAGANDSTPYNSARDVHSATPPAPPWPYSTFKERNYIVDPLGWQMSNKDNPSGLAGYPPRPDALLSPRDYFGNTTPAVVNWPIPRRYTGASIFGTVNPYPDPADPVQIQAAVMRSFQLVTQPDNWKVIGEGQFVDSAPTGATSGITGATLDGDTDLSSVNSAAGVTYRAVIYDVDGNHSEVRDTIRDGMTVTYVGNAWEVKWLTALPTRFNSPTAGALPNIGKVRIEVANQNYTWMLSVRKRSNGLTGVDVVVFFNRNFDPNNERVFDAEFRKYKLWRDAKNDYDGSLALRKPGVAGPGAAGDDDGINGVDDVGEIGYPGIYSIEQDVPNGTVTIKVPSAATDDARPKLRRGGYIYDTTNGLWYRIRAMQNEQFGVGPGSNEDWIDVVLDEAIRQDSTEDLDGSGDLNLTGEDRNRNAMTVKEPERGGAIVHPNVVNVFPLEIKEP